MNNNILFESTLKDWFDRCLAPGMAYNCHRQRTEMKDENSKLVYQDGTACSWSCAFSDIFLLPDNTYIVQTLVDVKDEYNDVEVRKCNGLIEVFNLLVSYNFAHLNSTGKLIREYLQSDMKDEQVTQINPYVDILNFNVLDYVNDELFIQAMVNMQPYTNINRN